MINNIITYFSHLWKFLKRVFIQARLSFIEENEKLKDEITKLKDEITKLKEKVKKLEEVTNKPLERVEIIPTQRSVYQDEEGDIYCPRCYKQDNEKIMLDIDAIDIPYFSCPNPDCNFKIEPAP